MIVSKGYHSGGGSYVLSRESVKRFYEGQRDPASGCQKDGGSEDVAVAQCLRNKGVYPGKSLDKQNRELFHPLPFGDHFRGSFPDWLHTYAENPLRTVNLLLEKILFWIQHVPLHCSITTAVVIKRSRFITLVLKKCI